MHKVSGNDNSIMQTFLPHSTFIKCAHALDNKRLNKQILEGYQILNVNSGMSRLVDGVIILQFLCGKVMKAVCLNT